MKGNHCAFHIEKKAALGLLFAALLVLSACAGAEIIASGIWNGSTWVLDNNYELTITAGVDDSVEYLGKWSEYDYLIKDIVFVGDVIMPTNCTKLFADHSEMVSIDFGDANFSHVTSIKQMFYNCTSLVTLDLNSWDTSRIQNMESLFSQCEALESVELGVWDTSCIGYQVQL